MAQATLLDIAKLTGADKEVGLIEESLQAAPELAVFPARTIKGTSYRTVVRTGRPTVSFRQANSGATPSKSTFRNALIECYILSAAVQVDKAVGDAYEDGLGAWEMIEASGVMRQALIEIADQIWYGVTTDANGFPGLKAATTAGGAMTVDSGGSNVGTASSIYAVKFGPQDVQLIFGGGNALSLSAFSDQTLYDSSSRAYPGRTATLSGWIGMQVGNTNCVGRIYNVGDFGETNDMADDAIIAELLYKFPVGYMPNALFMSRRSQRQLQVSRTVTINSGPGSSKVAGSVEAVAPPPESAFGIPIYVTDSILNTDTVGT